MCLAKMHKNNRTSNAKFACPIDSLSIYELPSALVFVFVEEIIDVIVSATYAFYLVNSQVYLAMKCNK